MLKENIIYSAKTWSVSKIQNYVTTNKNKKNESIRKKFYYLFKSSNLFMVDFKRTTLSTLYLKLLEFESLNNISDESTNTFIWAIYEIDKGYHITLLSDFINFNTETFDRWANIFYNNPNSLDITLIKISSFQRFSKNYNKKNSKPPKFIGFFGDISSINDECLEYFCLNNFLTQHFGKTKILLKNEISLKLSHFSEYFETFKNKITLKSYIKIITIFIASFSVLFGSMDITNKSSKQLLYFISILSGLYLSWVIFNPTIYGSYINYSLAPKLLKLIDNNTDKLTYNKNNQTYDLLKQIFSFLKINIEYVSEELQTLFIACINLYLYVRKTSGLEEAELCFKKVLSKILCNFAIFAI